MSLVLASPLAAADIVDPNVTGFAATPSYVNLNMTTSVAVTLGSVRGGGLDDYLVTVTKPGGSGASAWYNFTAVGTISRQYGNAGADFATRIDEPGTYELRLDYFDGTSFTRAASSQLLATDELIVTLEAATASNEYTDVHNCPIAQEFQRGGEIIGRAYVRYASTGEFVNGTRTPSAVGNITGTLLGETKVLRWQNVYHFWRWAWFPTWNATVGSIVFTVDARDGRGNHGVASSLASGLTAWRIIPAILKVVPRIVNDTGVETVSFLRGENLTVQSRVTYESHNAHNRAFPGPLNATRGGQVTAVLGYGPYNASSGRFAQTLTTLSLSLDVASQNWTGTYRIRETDSVRPDLQVVVRASDGASPANTGTAFATRFAIDEPEAAPLPPPPGPSGLDPILAGGLAVLALFGGLGVGIAVARRGRKARGAEPGAPPSKPEAGKAEEEWVVEEEKEGPQ
ncbi:MAG: hypothetical protein WC985_02445 [Thermoplasmata archaeon]